MSFLLKDAPLWIDDYTAQATIGGNNELRRKTDRLLRDWGNRAGRSRMRSDLTMRQAFAPRGLVISTAEILPPGQSILSRLFTVEFTPTMVTRGEGSRLTLAQENDAPLYRHAMAGYVQWLAGQYKALEEELPGKLRSYTEDARAKGTHLRMPGNIAEMFIGFEMGMRYALTVGAIGEAEADGLLSRAWVTLIEIGGAQHQAVIEENPVDMFLEALEQMMAQGAVYLRCKDKPEYDDLVWPASLRPRDPTRPANLPSEGMLGWYDDKYWYLMPKATYNTVYHFYRNGGIVFPDTERGIRAKLREQKLSVSNDGRLLYQVDIDGERVRVLCIGKPQKQSLIPINGENGESGESGE
jgi:hypothetical protein